MQVVSKENIDRYVWSQVCDGWRLLDDADLAVKQERMPPGTAEVPHHHEKARQFFFVLSGELTIIAGGTSFALRVNHGLEIPPGVVHEVKNSSGADVQFLVISAPQSKGDRILANQPSSASS